MPHEHVETQVRQLFLLVLHATILLLSGLAVCSAGVAWMTHTVMWDLPKTAELKLYAAIISAGAAGAWIGVRFFPDALKKERPLYTLFWSLALPMIISINAMGSIGAYRLGVIFGISVIGIGAAIVDSHHRKNHRLQSISARIFPFYMTLSVMLLVIFAKQNSLTFLSVTTLCTFCAVLLLLSVPALRLPRFADIPLMILFLFFVFFTMFGMGVNLYHYSYYLGPVVEMLYGHKHPLVEINAQYGGGLTTFLTAYFWLWGHVSNSGMNLLIKLCTVLQFGALYVIARSLLRSRMLAFCTLLAMLMFNCFSQAGDFFNYPSVGPLRFGHLFLILLLYSVPLRKNGDRLRMHGCALIAAIATLWSFESLVYTVPAWMAAEVWSGRGKNAALHYGGYLLILLCAYLLPPLLQGQSVSLYRYIEYSMLYADGFGQISLNRLTDLWWLFPVLSLLIVMEVLCGKIKDMRVFMLAIYGLAIFTYFVGRAHPNNLHHIALPVILLGVYWLQENTHTWKTLCISGFLVIFLATNLEPLGTGSVASQLLKNNPVDLHGFNAFLPGTDETTDCAEEKTALSPYIYHHSLALIDSREELYMLYDCLQVSNAFNADPWSETAINPLAISRMLRTAMQTPNPFFLVNAVMLDEHSTQSILSITRAEKTGSVAVGGQDFLVYAMKR